MNVTCCDKQPMEYVGGLDYVCSRCGTKIRLVAVTVEPIEVQRPQVLHTHDPRYTYRF